MNENSLKLEIQYQLYLKRVGLNFNTMGPNYIRETRRAFMGACGQILILMRDVISQKVEEEAVMSMEDLLSQVQDFWEEEMKNQKP